MHAVAEELHEAVRVRPKPGMVIARDADVPIELGETAGAAVEAWGQVVLVRHGVRPQGYTQTNDA